MPTKKLLNKLKTTATKIDIENPCACSNHLKMIITAGNNECKRVRVYW